MTKAKLVRVRVTAGARKESVVETGGKLVISVREPAERNAANARVRVLVARHCKVEEKVVRLVSGQQRAHKTYKVVYPHTDS